MVLGLCEAIFAVQSHAFHLAFTTVIGLAAYQAVIALARNSEDFDTWDGVLMTGANVALLFPVLAIPIIFGGLRSRRLRDLTPALMVSPPSEGTDMYGNSEEFPAALVHVPRHGHRTQ